MRVLITALLLASFGALTLAAESPIETSDAWIRLPPPGSRTAAGYVAIENTGATVIEIKGVRSEAFGSAMLHETSVDEQGMSRMRHLHSVRIDPGETFRFEPNGPHLMLFDPVEPLREGAKIAVELDLGAESMEILFPVLRSAPGE